MAKKHELTEMQKIFCANYIMTGNAYESAIKAGYSESFAKTKAGQLAKQPKIEAYMKGLMEERTDALQDSIASVDEILIFLSDSMRGKNGNKPSERLKSAELLGRYYSLFTDKVVSTEVKQVLFTNDLLPEEDDKLYLPQESVDFIETIEEIEEIEEDNEDE